MATANSDRFHEFRSSILPPGAPDLPDCRTVLSWDADGNPTLRWETLHERDARLHKEWYEERLRKMGYRAFAPRKGEGA